MDMWNPKKGEELIEDDDESWEVKAFEQDTIGNISGTTWPPRSYTCNFCRREFRSAQALGGHMNVHRRDRASSRAQQGSSAAARGSGRGTSFLSTCVPSTVIIQSRESSNIEGLSHFYQFQNPNGIYGNSGEMMNFYDTTSFPSSNLEFSILNSPVEAPPRLIEYPAEEDDDIVKERTGASVDEPDLELRLGQYPP